MNILLKNIRVISPAQNIDEHLTDLRSDRAGYESSHPENIAEIEKLKNQSSENTP